MPEFDSRNIVHMALVIQDAMRNYIRARRDDTYTQTDVEHAGIAAGMVFSKGKINPATLESLVQREQSVYPVGMSLRCI